MSKYLNSRNRTEKKINLLKRTTRCQGLKINQMKNAIKNYEFTCMFKNDLMKRAVNFECE